MGSLFLLQGIFPIPRIEPRSPTLQVDSLSDEPQGKPKNTGVGSLSLLQQIFPIQELNQGLLHCRRIIYQLSYQASPKNVLRTSSMSLAISPILRLFDKIPSSCINKHVTIVVQELSCI